MTMPISQHKTVYLPLPEGMQIKRHQLRYMAEMAESCDENFFEIKHMLDKLDVLVVNGQPKRHHLDLLAHLHFFIEDMKRASLSPSKGAVVEESDGSAIRQGMHRHLNGDHLAVIDKLWNSSGDSVGAELTNLIIDQFVPLPPKDKLELKYFIGVLHWLDMMKV